MSLPCCPHPVASSRRLLIAPIHASGFVLHCQLPLLVTARLCWFHPMPSGATVMYDGGRLPRMVRGRLGWPLPPVRLPLPRSSSSLVFCCKCGWLGGFLLSDMSCLNSFWLCNYSSQIVITLWFSWCSQGVCRVIEAEGVLGPLVSILKSSGIAGTIVEKVLLLLWLNS